MKKIAGLFIIIFTIITVPVFADTQPNKVYFDKDAVNPVLEMIDGAKNSIIIEMYGFTNYKPVIESLEKAAKRNVEICAIIDNQDSNKPDKKNNNGELVGFPEQKLESLGALIKWDKFSRTMHRKVAVVDEEVVWIGSTNWTNGGFEKNNEIDIRLHDPEIAKEIIEKFNNDWENAVESYPIKGENPDPDPPKDPQTDPIDEIKFIGNSNTMKFHLVSCRYVKDISEKNKVEFKTREEAVDKGYQPCKVCKP